MAIIAEKDALSELFLGFMSSLINVFETKGTFKTAFFSQIILISKRYLCSNKSFLKNLLITFGPLQSSTKQN